MEHGRRMAQMLVSLSAAGADGNGTRLLERLKSPDEDSRHLLISETGPTGMAWIIVELTDENMNRTN